VEFRVQPHSFAHGLLLLADSDTAARADMAPQTLAHIPAARIRYCCNCYNHYDSYVHDGLLAHIPRLRRYSCIRFDTAVVPASALVEQSEDTGVVEAVGSSHGVRKP